MDITHPTNTLFSGASSGLVQPALTGLEALERYDVRPIAQASSASRRAELATDRRTRRRYWSVRDLSRRLWLGRGYELLRGLIHAGILPATRSARSWWIDDEDAAGLIAAFEDRAGKVRAFRGLDTWLHSRCYATPLTPEVETLTRLTRSGLAWRGHIYLPKAAWAVELEPDPTNPINETGTTVEYRHRSGVVVEGAATAVAPEQIQHDEIAA
ncbi:MAG TPA: hypothetical protein VNM48_21015 [Chloroflexota bacterium]|nr:hypothetical protein [Chloroflexota bacterium]